MVTYILNVSIRLNIKKILTLGDVYKLLARVQSEKFIFEFTKILIQVNNLLK